MRTIAAHRNGIFDIQWNSSDNSLATCSGDTTIRISDVETSRMVRRMDGHTGTPKTIAWHPWHPDLLSSAGRDGNVCIWDVRAEGEDESGCPVARISAAHEEWTLTGSKSRPKTSKSSTPRTVTGLLYNEMQPYELITSGSSDG